MAPPPHDHPITVVFAADQDYALPAAVALASLQEFYRDSRPLHIFFLDCGLKEEQHSMLQSLLSKDHHPLRCIPLPRRALKGLKTSDYIQEATYARLLIPNLLPLHYHRAIYLDADIIVQKNIAELWDTDLQGMPFGAVQDPLVPTIGLAQAVSWLRQWQWHPTLPYLNAGVLLLDLDLWRKEQLGGQAIAYVREHPEDICWWDQDALNALFADRWLPLHRSWNVAPPEISAKEKRVLPIPPQESSVAKHPFIIHFMAPCKPWKEEYPASSSRELFLSYARKIGWEVGKGTEEAFDPTTLPPPGELFGLSDQEQALALFELARQGKRSIIEIGTYCGYTALLLAFGIRNRQTKHAEDATVFTVDNHVLLSPTHRQSAPLKKPDCLDIFFRNAKSYGVLGTVLPIIGNAADAWRYWTYGMCDLLFIDGDHAQALRDFEHWSTWLLPGGTVCFHDYAPDYPQVMRDVDTLVRRGAIEPMAKVGSLFVARYLCSGQPLPPPDPTGAYTLFANLKSLWGRCGMPFPQLARRVRHAALGQWWPAYEETLPPPGERRSPSTPPTVEYAWNDLLVSAEHITARVAVIIPCHNYGQYLTKTIESILRQSYLPQEIVVIDDSSTDDTPLIAASFADQGVRTVRGHWHDVASARNHGAHNTTAPFLLFLDADDSLPPDYIERCLEEMRDPSIAIVYGDMSHVGEESYYQIMPEFDRDLLARHNFISSHALIRRLAFDVIGGFRTLDNAHQDWDLYRRIIQQGWSAKRARTYVQYRVHSESMLQRYLRGPSARYPHEAALLSHPLTLFTPFTGRWDALEPYLTALRSLCFDPHLIHLHWFDMSTDPAFSQALRHAMSSLPFGRTTYTKAPLPPLLGQTPWYSSQLALVYAYNTLLRTCTTEYAITWEEDILPSPHAIEELLSALRADVAAVVASYHCRFRDCLSVWKLDAAGFPENLRTRSSGITEVGGSGFGFSLFRVSSLRQCPIQFKGDQSGLWTDAQTFLRLRDQGSILCNWNIDISRLDPPPSRELLTHQPSPPTIAAVLSV